MNKSRHTTLATPPPPEYLPCPPAHWLEEMKKKKITFCHECENIYYIYDKEKQSVRQYLYKCNCEL